MSGVIAVLATGRPALGAAAAPAFPYGSKIGPGTVLTSQSIVVTVIGGAPPYTYLWTRVSGDTQIGPISGTSNMTKFSAYHSSAGTFNTMYKCVVTDATATSVDSNAIDITLESLS